MEWLLDKKRPICPQLYEHICILIASGEIAAGEKLMSVRDVALSAGVTPNTVQKSFEQLEQSGVIYSKRGSGWYVSEDVHIAGDVLRDMIRSKTDAFLSDMRSLKLSDEDILNVLKEVMLHERNTSLWKHRENVR